jgi:CelD/BcsL family acetyltransferase involved in cellulose biosynthesis
MSQLEAEWEVLADRAAAPPFLRPGWFDAWRGAFGEGESRMVELRSGGELLGVVPMLAQSRRLVSQTSWHTPSFTPLALDDAARHELALSLFAQPETVVDLNLLALESAGGIEALVAAAREAGRLPVVRELVRAPFVGLPGTYEEYMQTLSGNRRRAMRRKRRRLEEAGEVTFDVYDGSAELDSLLGQLYEIEASGWKSERGETIVSRPELKRFYDEFSAWAAERGWLRLAFVRLDGRPIAIQLILEYGDTWYLVRMGYDETFRPYGPGAVLMHELIRHCCEQPELGRIDLLGESEEFKASWATGDEPRYWLLAYRRTPAGLAGWAETTTRRRVGSALRRVKQRSAEH